MRPRIEVAFVLDTTGSMSGLIDGAKRKIWQVANQLASGKPTPEIRMALVGYRDRGDVYVTRVRDLTADLDAIYAELQAFQADGGGDGPESVNQALHEARTKLSWSRDPGRLPRDLPGGRRAPAHGLRAGRRLRGERARGAPRRHRGQHHPVRRLRRRPRRSGGDRRARRRPLRRDPPGRRHGGDRGAAGRGAREPEPRAGRHRDRLGQRRASRRSSRASGTRRWRRRRRRPPHGSPISPRRAAASTPAARTWSTRSRKAASSSTR